MGRLTWALSVLLSLLFLTCLVLVAMNAVFWSAGLDDFYIKMEVARIGHLNFIRDQWLGWDGRSVSPFFLIRNLLIARFGPEEIGIITTIVFLTISWILQKLIFFILDLSSPRIIQFVLTICITLGLWLALRAHMARSIYWPTGSIYTWFNLTMILAFYSSTKNSRLLYCCAFFVASLSGVNVALGLLVFCFLTQLLGLWKVLWKTNVALYGLIVLGGSICTLAPGNFVRARHTGHLVFTDIFDGYFQVLVKYASISKWVVVSALVIALILNFIGEPIRRSRTLLLKWSFVFLMSALATIVPFVILPGIASKHTAIFFQTSCFVAFFLIFTIVIRAASVSLTQIWGWTVATIFMVAGIWITFNQYSLGLIVKEQIQARHIYLESKSGTNEVVYIEPLIQPEELFATRLWDLSSDSTDYVNIRYSEFFGTGPISVVNSRLCN